MIFVAQCSKERKVWLKITRPANAQSSTKGQNKMMNNLINLKNMTSAQHQSGTLTMSQFCTHGIPDWFQDRVRKNGQTVTFSFSCGCVH